MSTDSILVTLILIIVALLAGLMHLLRTWLSMSIKSCILGFLLAIALLCGAAQMIDSERQRAELARRLERNPTASWEELERYLDCHYLTVGISRYQFDSRARSLVDRSKIEEDTRSGWGEDVLVHFDSFGLADRYYYFSDGWLTSVDHYLNPLDGTVPVRCN